VSNRLERVNPRQLLVGAVLGSVACLMFMISVALGERATTFTYLSVTACAGITGMLWWLYARRRDESTGR
jgi:hypothetical protein